MLLMGEVVDIVEEGNRLIQFTYEGIFEEIFISLDRCPFHLILHIIWKIKTRQQYMRNVQVPAAAPTAGLHFTPKILRKLRKRYQYARVTLHVGLGTFRPVKVDEITDHHMHSEFFRLRKRRQRRLNGQKIPKESHLRGNDKLRTYGSETGAFESMQWVGQKSLFIRATSLKCWTLSLRISICGIYASSVL